MSNGLTPEDIEVITQHELKTRYPEECRRLPLGYLEENERILAQKCIEGEELTKNEIDALKELLGRYRNLISKYDSVQLEENLESNIQVIKTSNDLLSLLDNPNRYRFDMHYKINNQIFRLQLRIKPLADNEYIDLLNVQTRVVRDLDKNEKVVYSKAANDQPLSKEEEKMLQHIQDKIVDKLGDVDNNNDEITKFLIDHVELVDDENLSKKDRRKFWRNIDLGTRTLVYNKCKEILKVDEELEVDLFPSIG